MKSPFDFDTVYPRRGTDCLKWDTPVEEGVLPMWVADMDFRTAPAVIDAVTRRAEQGIYGYAKVPDAYYRALCGWFERRHRWRIDPQWVIYTTGVVPAVSAVIKALTVAGDRVIIQPPVYNCFYSSIRNNGCECSANPLRCDDGRFTIDFDDLEAKAADPRARVLLLCNPHNPAGRVWTSDELRRVGDICLRHDVTVVADEIHCELTRPGLDYTPFATLSPEFQARCAVCNSPSKAFNLAGMQTANIIAADPELRRRIDRAVNDNEVCDIGPFGIAALIAAYDCGAEWLDALRDYLWANYECVRDFFAAELPDFPIARLEGTYLLWIDCRAAGLSSEELAQHLLNDCRLMVSPGTLYGSEGEGYLRLNIACPRSLLVEGLQRLKNGLARR